MYGLTSEYKYSYQSYYSGETGACQYDSIKPTAEVSLDGYIRLPSNDYDSLLHAVATIGPMAVNVDASVWHSYETGVFNGCAYDSNIDIDHVVVLEGYGSDPKNGDYWLIRNSWGTGFGENGYMRLTRESTPKCGMDTTTADGTACKTQWTPTKVCGQCGIAWDATYPLNARAIL